jgi:ABC-type transporter Mla MlaB component
MIRARAGSDMEQPCYRLDTVVRYDDVAAVRAAGEHFIDITPGVPTFSLVALSESNSLVVALLLAWVRYAAARSRTLRIVDAPRDLRNIIELYGIATLLPLEQDGRSSGLFEITNDQSAAPAAVQQPES